MENKYAYIDGFQEIKDIPFKNPFIKYFKDKAIKKHMIKHFPNTMEDISYANKSGYYIKIPILKSLPSEDEYYINNIISAFNQHLTNYDVDILVLDPSLKKYKEQFKAIVAMGETLGILYISEIIKEVKQSLSKEEKDIRFVLIDGVSSDTEYVLDHIVEDTNALILVTDEPAKYEDKLFKIYEEFGLAVELRDKAFRQNIEGDIIIHCSNKIDKLFYYYDKGSVVLDFMSHEKELQKMKMKRNDLKIVYNVEPYFEDEKWNADLLLGVLLNKEYVLKNAYRYGYSPRAKDKIDLGLQKYKMTFDLKSF